MSEKDKIDSTTNNIEEIIVQIDRELERILSAVDTDIKILVSEISNYILKLLLTIYRSHDINDVITNVMSDISRSREYILAIYLCILLSLSGYRLNLDKIPEDVLREFLGRLLIFYEKIKHIKKLIK